MSSLKRRGRSKHLSVFLILAGSAGILAGCGGGSSRNSANFTPIAAPALGTVTAQQTAVVERGRPAFIESPIQQNTSQTGGTRGIVSATLLLPEGALLENATLGIAVLPFSNTTLERIRRADPTTVSPHLTLAEIIFGRVTTNNALLSATNALSTGPTDAPSYRIKLTPERSGEIDKLLAVPGNTYQFLALVRDELSFHNRLIQPRDCRVTYDTANDLITVDGCRAHDLIVTLSQVQP